MSEHSSMHTHYMSLFLGVLSFGWTNSCLKVWPGLRLTQILFFWKILLNFSERPATFGMTMFLLVSLSASSSSLWPFGQFDKGPLQVATCLEHCLDLCQFLLFPPVPEGTFWTRSCPDYPQFVVQCVVEGKQEVMFCVCELP